MKKKERKKEKVE